MVSQLRERDFQSESLSLNKKSELEAQIDNLSSEIGKITAAWRQNEDELRRDRDEAERRANKLQSKLDRLKEAPKPVAHAEIDLSSAQ